MLFNSFHYLVFLIAVVVVHWLVLRTQRLRVWWLLAASYYFYMCWNWKFISLILFSTLLDFTAGQEIFRSTNRGYRRMWLVLSLVGNLGCLAVFKYFDFFLESLQVVTDSVGLNASELHLEIILPVGISFYTFQTLSYTIDIYRGNLRPTTNVLQFALFVAFFPQLVAGPIVRASEFLPQVYSPREYSDSLAMRGVWQILVGLFKKICIADVLAVSLVDPAFAAPDRFSGLALLLAVIGYALQIYCDFSGYSDVAIGSARLIGYELPMNFDRPYVAASVTEFWHRWHISLSTWLRDYLYIPLGGNRGGKVLTYRNLMITMLLGGLWHGAGWNFVLWGGVHGLLLCGERVLWGRRTLLSTGECSRTVLFARQLATFCAVCFTWLVFRTSSLEECAIFVSRIGTMASGVFPANWQFAGALCVGYFMHFTSPDIKLYIEECFVKSNVVLQAGFVTLTLLLFAAACADGTPFIYFQF